MDKGLTVSKWVLINQPKVPQMPQNLSAQIVYPSPKVLVFRRKKAPLDVRSPCGGTSMHDGFCLNVGNTFILTTPPYTILKSLYFLCFYLTVVY